MYTGLNFSNSLKNMNSKLLISCPKDPRSEGGLFTLDFNLNNISQILTADCRGIVSDSDFIYLATNSHGILKLDQDLNIIKKYDVPALDLHGLKMDSNGFLYVVETKHNAIGIYRTNPFERIDEIKISPDDIDQNHINDIWIDGESLYVSMFSYNGGWRQIEGAYDGVIAEYNLQTKSLEKIIQHDLQLPHSVIKHDGRLFFCESFNMNLKEDDKLVAQFNGFTRGLATDGVHFFIGQSQMRHLDKILSKNMNVSLDCGIHVFNSIMRTNHFIHFPVNQIYEIMIMEDANVNENIITLDFTDPDTTQYIFPQQWHEPEGTHRWMKTEEALIKIKKNSTSEKLVIDAFNGFPGEYNVKILVNRIFVGNITFSAAEDKHSVFQLNTQSGTIEILIIVDKLWSPSRDLLNEDTRELGLALKKIMFL